MQNTPGSPRPGPDRENAAPEERNEREQAQAAAAREECRAHRLQELAKLDRELGHADAQAMAERAVAAELEMECEFLRQQAGDKPHAQ